MSFLSNLFGFSPKHKKKSSTKSVSSEQPKKSRKKRSGSKKKSRKRRSVNLYKSKFGFEVLPEHIGKFCCVGKDGCVKIDNVKVKCSGKNPWKTEKSCKNTCDFQIKTYDSKINRKVAKEEREQAKIDSKTKKMKFSGKKKKIDTRTSEQKQAAKDKMAKIRAMRK